MKAWCSFSWCFVCLQAAGRDANGLTWMGLSSSVAKSVTEMLCFCFRRQTFHLCWHQNSPWKKWRWKSALLEVTLLCWMLTAGGAMGELRCMPTFLAEWCKDEQLALEAASRRFLSVSKLCSFVCQAEPSKCSEVVFPLLLLDLLIQRCAETSPQRTGGVWHVSRALPAPGHVCLNPRLQSQAAVLSRTKKSKVCCQAACQGAWNVSQRPPELLFKLCVLLHAELPLQLTNSISAANCSEKPMWACCSDTAIDGGYGSCTHLPSTGINTVATVCISLCHYYMFQRVFLLIKACPTLAQHLLFEMIPEEEAK